MRTLWPYQEASSSSVKRSFRKGSRATIMQLPTGGGKTTVVANMVAELDAKGKSVWFVAHRHELLDQASRELNIAGVRHGRVDMFNDSRARVVVASKDSMIRRMYGRKPPNLLVLDECHRSVAPTYKRLIKYCEKSFVLGLTATPERLDGQGLGDIYQELCIGPTTRQLIEWGYLSDYRMYGPPPNPPIKVRKVGGDYVRGDLEQFLEDNMTYGEPIKQYHRHIKPGMTCLVYCVNRHHARLWTERYNHAGIEALYVAGDTPKKERDDAIDRIRDGDLPVIVSVDLFGEGLDLPGLTAIQMLRPTMSRNLYRQMCGRTFRKEENKPHAIILDQVGNRYRHGFPDDDVEWTLDSKPMSKRTDVSEIAIAYCKECFAAFRVGEKCPDCGKAPVVKPREISEPIDGDLVEMKREIEILKDKLEKHKDKLESNKKHREVGAARTLKDLVRIEIARGYKAGWAAHRFAARTKEDASIYKSEVYRLRREWEGPV